MIIACKFFLYNITESVTVIAKNKQSLVTEDKKPSD